MIQFCYPVGCTRLADPLHLFSIAGVATLLAVAIGTALAMLSRRVPAGRRRCRQRCVMGLAAKPLPDAVVYGGAGLPARQPRRAAPRNRPSSKQVGR